MSTVQSSPALPTAKRGAPHLGQPHEAALGGVGDSHRRPEGLASRQQGCTATVWTHYSHQMTTAARVMAATY